MKEKRSALNDCLFFQHMGLSSIYNQEWQPCNTIEYLSKNGTVAKYQWMYTNYF